MTRSTTPRSRLARALGPEPFARQVVTHLFSTGGDAFFAVSLAGSLFFSVSLDAARPQVVLYLAATMAPFAVVAPIIGPVIDRFRGGQRAVIAVSLGARAAVCLLMAGDLQRLLFYPEAFTVLILGKTYSVAKSALVPALVPGDEDLVSANSRLTATGVLSGAAGGALAAGLLALTGAPWVLRAGAVVYAAGSAASVRIPRVTPRRFVPPALEYEELKTPTVGLASWAMVVLRAAIGFTIFLLGFALRREGEAAWVYGLVLVASGAGGFAGTLVATRLRRRVLEERIVALALSAPALVALLVALRFDLPGVLLAAFALGVGASAARQAFDSLVQRAAPDADRGRTFARFETRFQLAWVAGAIVPVLASLDDRLGLALLGSLLAAASVGYVVAAAPAARFDEQLRSLRRRVLDEPAEVPPSALADETLVFARSLHDRGAHRRAVLEAFTALEVERDRLRAAAERAADDDPALARARGTLRRLRRCAVESDEAVGVETSATAIRLCAAGLARLRGDPDAEDVTDVPDVPDGTDPAAQVEGGDEAAEGETGS